MNTHRFSGWTVVCRLFTGWTCSSSSSSSTFALRAFHARGLPPSSGPGPAGPRGRASSFAVAKQLDRVGDEEAARHRQGERQEAGGRDGADSPGARRPRGPSARAACTAMSASPTSGASGRITRKLSREKTSSPTPAHRPSAAAIERFGEQTSECLGERSEQWWPLPVRVVSAMPPCGDTRQPRASGDVAIHDRHPWRGPDAGRDRGLRDRVAESAPLEAPEARQSYTNVRRAAIKQD